METSTWRWRVGFGGLRLYVVIALTMVLIACSTKTRPVPAVDVLPTAAPPNPPDGLTARTFAPGVGISLSVPSTWVSAPPSSGFDYVMRDPGPSHEFVLVTRTKSVAADPYKLRQDRVHYLRRLGGTVTSTAIGTGLGRPIVVLHYHLPDQPTFNAVDDIEYDLVLPKGRVLLVIGSPSVHLDPALANWMASTIKLQ